MSWSAAAYSRFEAERTQPVLDLIARLPPRPFARVADLGCGPGNSTEALRARFPDAHITGIDSAPDMLRAARARLPGLTVTEADLTVWASQSSEPGFDLLFANASLQWVPNHARLLPRLLSRLSPGGILAIQVPNHYREPPHRVMRAIAGQAPWAEALRGAATTLIHHTPRWYFTTLSKAGARVTLWQTTYFHILPDAHAIVAFFQATALRPCLDRLSPTAQQEFLARYHEAIARAFPPLADGTVMMPFPRLFLLAERPA